MVGQTVRSSYKKKRKGKPFSGTQRYAAKEKKAVPADDFETDETQSSTSRVANQSDSDSEKPIGSSRKKMEKTSKNLSIESSDDDMSFQPEESKGYRMIDLRKTYPWRSQVPTCVMKVRNFRSAVIESLPHFADKDHVLVFL